jgi:hypothetical protein
MKILKSSSSSDEQFIHWSPVIISSIYMVVQIPISLIFGIGSSTISYKDAILVNTIVLVIAWGATLSGLAGNEHIRKVNSRQKDHHTTL